MNDIAIWFLFGVVVGSIITLISIRLSWRWFNK
jgi:tetrahydromethanopterin S-methyltransferase subunit G